VREESVSLYEVSSKINKSTQNVFHYNFIFLIILSLTFPGAPNVIVPRQMFDTLIPQFGPNQLYSTDGLTFASDILYPTSMETQS